MSPTDAIPAHTVALPAAPAETPARREFEERGFLGPVRVLTGRRCRDLLWEVTGDRRPRSLEWGKGFAVTSRAYYDLARQPAIYDRVVELIGHEVLLWGASLLVRTPGAVHPWHSDIESATCGGRTVSVWIGLKNTTRDSSLLLISHTHTLGATIQEVQQREGHTRHDTTEGDILRWARAHHPGSDLIQPDMDNGGALFFDGRLWHGSRNRFRGTRVAVLLQYATPDAVLRIPDLNRLDWPFQKFEFPQPPCLMLEGSAPTDINRIVRAPAASDAGPGAELTSRIHPLRLPLASDEKRGWRPYPLFHGYTAELDNLTCHVSALSPGRTPHPPHRHEEEELLLVLAGEVDLILGVSKAPEETQRFRFRAGDFTFYPAWFAHTLETVGDVPANYLMFKWRNRGVSSDRPPLAHGRFSAMGFATEAGSGPGFRTHLLFEGPTAHLRRLHAHLSRLEPGAGYKPHIDAYDVALVVLEGVIETLGGRAGPHDIVFYRSGEPHGMHNPGCVPARYIVFEFLGRGRPPHVTNHQRFAAFFAKVTDPARWKRKLARWSARLRPSQHR